MGSKTAEIIAREIGQIKGFTGGRFYINEFCQMFAPRGNGNKLEYVYIGKIEDLNNWFPKPDVSIQLSGVKICLYQTAHN